MLSVAVGFLAGFFAVQWFRSELAGRAAAIILEQRSIFPNDEEIRAASRTALEQMLRFRK